MKAFWLVLVLFCAQGLTAQTAPDSPVPAQNPAQPAAAPPAATLTNPPQPYSDKEFPDWLLKLRRAEIITVGAFPLAYLFAGLGYDYSYYLSNGYPQENAPWPVGPGTSLWAVGDSRLQKKNLTLLSSAIGASLLVAAADWVLGW